MTQNEPDAVSFDEVMSGEDRLFQPVEVGYVLRVSTSTIQRLCREGKLEATRIGAGWRIRKSEIRRYLREGPRDA